jgi:NTP pyrophosphatase (non-canonical NTP hydrolase)
MPLEVSASTNMSLQSYQKQIDGMLQAYEKPYWHPLSQLARLAEEVGEVSRILNHQYGDKPKKSNEDHEKLEDELADVLYTVLCLANSQDIQLDGPLQKAIAKLETRDQGRFKKKPALKK